MSLSGSIKTTVQTHWTLSLEWTAKQDITNNKSTITATLYWISDQYGATSTTASKTCAIQYNNGTWQTYTAAGLASLTASQKKKLYSISFTITHDANGNASFSLDGYFDVYLNLSGVDVNRIDLAQTTFTLNQIEQDGKMLVYHGTDWDIGVCYVYVSGVWKKSKSVYIYTGGVWKVDNTS